MVISEITWKLQPQTFKNDTRNKSNKSEIESINVGETEIKVHVKDINNAIPIPEIESNENKAQRIRVLVTKTIENIETPVTAQLRLHSKDPRAGRIY